MVRKHHNSPPPPCQSRGEDISRHDRFTLRSPAELRALVSAFPDAAWVRDLGMGLGLPDPLPPAVEPPAVPRMADGTRPQAVAGLTQRVLRRTEREARAGSVVFRGGGHSGAFVARVQRSPRGRRSGHARDRGHRARRRHRAGVPNVRPRPRSCGTRGRTDDVWAMPGCALLQRGLPAEALGYAQASLPVPRAQGFRGCCGGGDCSGGGRGVSRGVSERPRLVYQCKPRAQVGLCRSALSGLACGGAGR